MICSKSRDMSSFGFKKIVFNSLNCSKISFIPDQGWIQILTLSRGGRNFCSPSKNSETSKKNQERVLFGHFWIDTKKSYFIQMFKPAQNIMSLLLQNIQIPPPSSTDWHPYPQKTIKSSQYAPQTPQNILGP